MRCEKISSFCFIQFILWDSSSTARSTKRRFPWKEHVQMCRGHPHMMSNYWMYYNSTGSPLIFAQRTKSVRLLEHKNGEGKKAAKSHCKCPWVKHPGHCNYFHHPKWSEHTSSLILDRLKIRISISWWHKLTGSHIVFPSACARQNSPK